MYRFTPDEIDHERAHHQAVIQGPTTWMSSGSVTSASSRLSSSVASTFPSRCGSGKTRKRSGDVIPESFSGHDFEVFGYTVDVKSSRDVSAFLPESLVERDPDDDIVVMVWHRDNEDSLMLLGWERLETLKSKVETEAAFSGDSPEKLDHLAARPMNELLDLGPNTAHMNQKPENPFSPGIEW